MPAPYSFTRRVDNQDERVLAEYFNELQRAIEEIGAGAFNVLNYGAIRDGVTNDYQAVADALEDAAGNTLVFPPGVYLNDSNTSWILPKYTRLIGAGGNPPFAVTGGARLLASDSMTTDLMIGETIDDASDYWAHGSQVINIAFFADASQASGSGLRWCPGENSELNNCSFVGFPEAGVRLQGAMAPGYFNKVNFRDNKWGIWLDGDEDTDRGQIVGPLTVLGLSGDDNENLINIDNGDQNNPNDTGGYLNVHIVGIKAEVAGSGSFTTSAHNPLIRMWNANQCMVRIDGGFVTAFGNTDATTNLVKILENGSTNARPATVILESLTCRGYTNLIDDDTVGGLTYPWVGDSDDFNVWRRIGSVVYRGLEIGQLPVVKSANYTATFQDQTILVDASGGARTITLPAAASVPGKRYTIKRTSASNNVIVDGNASETIDGATTKTITTQHGFITIESDGTNWQIVALGGTIT